MHTKYQTLLYEETAQVTKSYTHEITTYNIVLKLYCDANKTLYEQILIKLWKNMSYIRVCMSLIYVSSG